jgi:hypothetical protein
LLKIIRPKETSKTAVVTGSKRNIRCETSRQFMNKKREYLKDKIDELAVNSKNKNIRDLYRGLNDFKWGHQPRSNLVMDENGDLLADYLSQLLNVYRVSDVRQREIHTAEPLVPDRTF